MFPRAETSNMKQFIRTKKYTWITTALLTQTEIQDQEK